MDKHQLSHLLHIQQASKEDKLVLFVGAGVSANSGVPMWSQLIDQMKKELTTNETDYLKIAQLYKDARGSKECIDKVKEVLKYNKVHPTAIHEHLLSLKPCHIITTNYDNLLEQAINKNQLLYNVVREDKDIPNIVYPHTLIKMHGDYDRNNIVLTEDDYCNYAKNFPLIRAYVQSLFASKLVVFVGYSFGDIDLKMILGEVKDILADNMQRAYLISLEERNDIEYRYFENKGINIVCLDKKDLLLPDGSPIALEGKEKHLIHIINQIKTASIESYEFPINAYLKVVSYKDELRSFGDGLKYFFPKGEKFIWNTHSDGLQTYLPELKNLAKQLNTNSAKRKYIADNPIIKLKELLQVAFYNYLGEIEGLKILDDKFYANIDYYITPNAVDAFRAFDFNKLSNILNELRCRQRTNTIDDLEYPYILHLIGNTMDSYKEYKSLLAEFWDQKKFILYFICLYNIRAIEPFLKYKGYIKEDIIMEEERLDDILVKLPLADEIRNTFQDLLSYLPLVNHVVKTDKLCEEIKNQRREAEKGGWSINSNMVHLMGLYHRELLFSESNYIIFDNNRFYQSVCYNMVLGTLNSYATPETIYEDRPFRSSRIIKLDAYMIRTLIFSIQHKDLQAIFERDEIKDIEVSDNGFEYIESVLKNLAESENVFKDISVTTRYVQNIVLVLSHISSNTKLTAENIYCVLLKYWHVEVYLTSSEILNILNKFTPDKEQVSPLLSKMLYESRRPIDYINGIDKLVSLISSENEKFSDIRIELLLRNEDNSSIFAVLYPVAPPYLTSELEKLCLTKIEWLSNYLLFIDRYNIIISDVERLKYLIKKTPHLDEDICIWLAKLRNNPNQVNVHGFIDELAKSNDCLAFYLSPESYSEYDKVNIVWILVYTQDISKRKEFFKNKTYRSKLKDYIKDYMGSKEIRNELIDLL